MGEGSRPPTLVLLHHFGGSARSWDGVIEALGGAFPTLALDLPGFGPAAGHPSPYSVDAYADFVARQPRPPGDWLLVGHSMGGKIALALAARRPAGLRALVLLAPSPPIPEPIDKATRARLIAGWRDPGEAEKTLARTTAKPLTSDLQERAIADMLGADRAAWNAWLEHGSREDISHLMGEIDVPVHVLSGQEDAEIPTGLLQRELLPRLPQARLTTMIGAGHLLPLEVPEQVGDQLQIAASTAR